MANREALREFQSRLAERLQAARTSGVSASWLAVESAGGKYLFPLSQSGEIFPFTGAQRVAYTAPWFMGVANLRGGIFGLVDMASFLTGSASTSGANIAEPAGRSQARVVALNAVLEVNCALLVDRLIGLRNPETFVESAPAPDGSPAYFGSGYTDAGGVYWQEINLQILSQQTQFLTISA